MTDYKKYINALRKCAKEHENDRTSTGHIIVSNLCEDTANLLESLDQEPTDKGYLVVGDCISREFIEIVVEYPPADLCTYPEYKGKPYFSIKYRENGKKYVGFGTYKIEILSQWIKEYFISNIQPKTGYWIDDEFGSKCSCCGIYTHLDKFDRPMKFKHCSNCGAKMLPADSNCDSCEYQNEVDGSNCYECVKGIRDNYKSDLEREE